ncbi:MAG TPA: acylphosphatase [Thermodesulfobacteriota bacterium]|nr:acylphosphatase [Thermodesulfobacteriota bacterium]
MLVLGKNMKTARAHVTIEGLVQGVFFRAHTRDAAADFGVKGWVRNNPNGTVEAVFEGKEDAVKKAVEWCKKGPPEARVENMDVRWEGFKNEFSGFLIRYRD